MLITKPAQIQKYTYITYTRNKTQNKKKRNSSSSSISSSSGGGYDVDDDSSFPLSANVLARQHKFKSSANAQHDW